MLNLTYGEPPVVGKGPLWCCSSGISILKPVTVYSDLKIPFL